MWVDIVIFLLIISFIIVYLINELYGLVYFIMLLPLNLQLNSLIHYFGFSLSLYYLTTFSFVLIFIFHRIQKKDFFMGPNYTYLFLIYFILLLISSFKSYNIELDNTLSLIRGSTVSIFNLPFFRSFSRIIIMGIFLFLPFIFYYYAYNKKYFFKMININIYVSSFITFISILFWLSFFVIDNGVIHSLITYNGADPFPRIKATLGEPLFFSLYLFTSLPILFFLILSKNKLFNKGIFYLMLIIQIVGLVLSFSRSGWLGLFIILIVFLIYNLRGLLNLMKRYYGLVLLLIVIIPLLTIVTTITDNFIKQNFVDHVVKSFIPNTNKVFSTLSRLITYKYGFISLRDNLFFGIGYGNFIFYATNKIVPWISGSSAPIQFPEINSLVLSYLVELGIIGFIIFSYIIFTIMRISLMSIKKSQSLIMVYVNTGFLAGFLAILVGHMFYSKLTYPFLWFYFGLMFASFDLIKTKNGA